MSKYNDGLTNEIEKVNILFEMLKENLDFYADNGGLAGRDYAKNHNASKAAILNQITTLRNELLVLKEQIKEN